jgi:hypothetical protein
VIVVEKASFDSVAFAVSYSSILKDGRFAADADMVDHDQVSKTPESGEFRERFTDDSFVRKAASPDLIQEFLPPGGSVMRD